MRIALAVVLASVAAGCGGGDNATSPDLGVADSGAMDLPFPVDGSVGSVARGEYLVKFVGVCGDCHTTPDATGAPSTDPAKFLAGGRAFALPGLGPDGGVGDVYAANLTNDNATGLGSWTTSNIVDAITIGVDKDGNPLWPIMPYWMFGNLTVEDANSIALYLKSLPAQSNAVPENTAPQPPQASPRVDDTMIPHTALASGDPNFASAERGRYLAKISCIDCHTTHNAPGAPSVLDLSKAFAGGEIFVVGPDTTISANLTPDTTGLASWSAADIVATLKTGLEKGTGAQVCAPMPAGAARLGGMSDADLNDVATFVHTLAPIANGPFGCDDGGMGTGLDGGH